MTSQRAQELTIQLEQGPVIVVVQEWREPLFMIGEEVLLHTNAGGAARVFHSDEDPYVDPDTKSYLPEDFEQS